MRSRSRWWSLPALAVAVAALVPLGAPTAAAVTCSSAGLTVTALHGPRFYTDLSITPDLRGAYAGYRVADTAGTARANLWVRLSGFSGGSVTLGGGQHAAQQVASLAAGGTASRFWYLNAAAESTLRQDHTVTVWQGRPDLPGSTALCTTSGGFTSVDGTIKAAANKLTSVEVSGGAPTVGSTFSVTVRGDTGTIGDGTADDPRSFWMSPSALGSWPASAYRLEHTSLSLGGTTYTDVLRVANLASGGAYTAVYTFRAVGFTSSSTDVLPVQQIASGTQIKHTDTGSLGSIPAIPPSTNSLTVTTSSTPTTLPAGGGTVRVTVRLDGTDGATLDDVTDLLPTGATYVAGSAQWQGTATADPAVAAGQLVFQGPFVLGPGPDLLTFDVVHAGRPGEQVNTVRAHVGDAVLDQTLDLTDDVPATSTVAVDTPPVAVDDAATAYAGDPATIAVLANDRDADGDLLSLTAVSVPGHGTATISGAQVVYTARPDFEGQDTFDYTVSDGRGGTGTGTVTVQVTAAPAADAADAVDDTVELQPGEAASLDVLANDTGTGLRVVAATGPAEPSADGTRLLVTGPQEPGTHLVGYTVEDADGRRDSATVTVTVPVTGTATVPPTPGPVASGDEVQLPSGGTASVDLLTNDTGTELRITSVGEPGHGVAELHGGTLTYRPARDFVGQDAVTYTVTDRLGRTASATVELRVLEGAAGVPDRTSTEWGQSVTVETLTNDPVGSELAGLVTAPEHGRAEPTDTGAVLYTPARTFAGTDAFTYRLVGSRQPVRVEVVVAAPALDPGADAVTTTRPEGPVVVAVLDNDTGHGLRVTGVTAPEHGAARVDGEGRVVYLPAADHTGRDSFGYVLEDIVGRRVTATVTVTVRNLEPALAPIEELRTVAGARLRLTAEVADPDGDRLTVRLATPTGTGGAHPAEEALESVEVGEVARGRARVELRLAEGFTGDLAVPVRVTDGHGGEATRRLRIAVAPRPAVGLTASVVGNPEGRRAVRHPSFVGGRPQSRMVSTTVDSRVQWRRSPTDSVRRYEVRVGEEVACRVAATAEPVQDCRLEDRVLDRDGVVTVRAVGQEGLTSEPDRVQVREEREGHLLAVVYFPSGEFFLDDSARRTLATLARRAGEAGYDAVTMVGHTDSDGSRRSNEELSQDRARSVRQYVLAHFDGVAVTDTDGYGEVRPAVRNRTERGKAANRRVEVYVGW